MLREALTHKKIIAKGEEVREGSGFWSASVVWGPGFVRRLVGMCVLKSFSPFPPAADQPP